MKDNPKYRLGTQANRMFMATQTADLLNFGKNFPVSEGGAGWLDEHGQVDPSHGIQTWITGRMTHVYSMGVLLGYPGSEHLVDEGLRGLTGILHDDTNGGWYPSIQANSVPEPGKSCYTHAFVIIAATSAYLAQRPGAKELLDEALETYDKYFWDDEQGLAVDTWDTTFTNLDSYRGLNANMHTTEAFLAVADATGNSMYRERAGRIINQVVDWASHNNWRIPEHFNQDWKPQFEYNADKKDDQFKPYGATPGHGIEWARLIVQWALSSLPNRTLAQPYIEAAQQLFHRALADGCDEKGKPGLAYTTDWEGNPVVTDRMHWTIAESINTAGVLAQVTGKTEYQNLYERAVHYADSYLIDHNGGSWFHQLNQDNEVIGTVWPGKSDIYHAFQCTLIPYLNPAVSICTALHNDKSNARLM